MRPWCNRAASSRKKKTTRPAIKKINKKQRPQPKRLLHSNPEKEKSKESKKKRNRLSETRKVPRCTRGSFPRDEKLGGGDRPPASGGLE